MAMQRPIIMGVRGEAQQIVADAGAGVNMTPDSAEDLVAAVEQLADDSEQAERLGRQARAYVAEHFNRDRLAQQYLELIDSLTESGEERGGRGEG